MENSEKFSRAGINFTISDYVATTGVKWYRALAEKPTPKGKYSKSKIEWYYKFPSAEMRDEYVNKEVARLERIQADIQKAKDIKKQAKKEAKNPFKVGDLFYDSWGYDQTNIDFYQIVEVGKMSVKLRAIASKWVEGTEGFMSVDVRPAKDNFLGDDHYRGKEITSIVQVRMWRDQVSYGIKGYYKDHGSLTKTTEDQSHYSSWYA